MELGVGLGGRPIGVPEAAGLEEGRGDRAALEQDVLDACPDRAVQLDVVVVGVVAAALGHGVDVEMVLEVRADAGQVVDDRHAHLPQMVGRADARQQQQARRADAARGDQHLALAAQHGGRAAALHDLDADGTAGLDDDARDQGAGLDGQVRAVADGLEVGAGGRGAARVADGDLVVPDALLLRTVEVRIVGDAVFLGRAQEGLADRQRVDRNGHAERAAIAMVLAGEPLIVLGALEVGQDLAIAPAGAALLVGPGVVVGGIAAGVDLGVDRGAAADHLGLGVPEHPVVQMLLRHGRPAPAGDALGHLGEAGGHVEERVPVGAAGLEQEDLDGGVGAQPVGQHAAGRPGAGDDVVVGHEASQVTVAGCRARRRRRSRCPSRSRTRRGRGPPPPGRRPAVRPSAGPAPGRRRSCDRRCPRPRRSCRCG